MKITWVKSPNYFPDSGEKTVIVIHKTLGLMPGTLNWLTKKKSMVSSHYIVTRKGQVYQLVKEKDGAWHCGVEKNPSAKWKKLDKGGNNNKFTIGIEFEALAEMSWTEKQIQAGSDLIKKIGIEDIVTHRDIASYKPKMDSWLTEIRKRIDTPPTEPDKLKLLKLQIMILKLKLLIARIINSRNK